MLRALVALLLLIWLARRVGLEAILRELEMAAAPPLLLATLLLALDSFAKAWNWRVLLERNIGARRLPLLPVLTWFFAGGFIGAIVPSSASTDACRVVLAARRLPGQAPVCAATIVTLNALGWFTGCIIGMAGLLYLELTRQLPRLLGPVALVFLATLAALPVVYALLVSGRGRVNALLAGLGERWPSIGHTIHKFVDALLVFEHAHVRFPVFLLVAALGLLAQTGMFALTAGAIGIDLPFAVWMVLVPLTRIVALVPVSIADFGLIQAAHVWVLSLFGVAPWEAFALSALFAVEGLLIHATLGSASFIYCTRRADFRLDGPEFVG